MIPANETFDGTFLFAPHFAEAPGFRMHYVDEGTGELYIARVHPRRGREAGQGYMGSS